MDAFGWADGIIYGRQTDRIDNQIQGCIVVCISMMRMDDSKCS